MCSVVKVSKQLKKYVLLYLFRCFVGAFNHSPYPMYWMSFLQQASFCSCVIHKHTQFFLVLDANQYKYILAYFVGVPKEYCIGVNFCGAYIFGEWKNLAVIHDFSFANGPVPTIY